MPNYAELYNPTHTPQNQPAPGVAQVANNAGGYVFQLDKWARLRRFLILGSDAPTYYQEERALTRENAECVVECWKEDQARTSSLIVEVSRGALAPKNDPAIFALALGSTLPEPHAEARRHAFAAVGQVCRTATHLFTWMDYRKRLGGGDGRGFKRAVSRWYECRPANAQAFQMVKYRNRAGWTHRDALRTSHARIQTPLAKWALGRYEGDFGDLPDIVGAHTEAMTCEPVHIGRLIELIEKYNLPWEALPTWALTSPLVWEAMAPHMGLTAVIRKLGVMTSCGAITPENHRQFTDRLGDEEQLRAARIHPFGVLQALAVYRAGRGYKSKAQWQPVQGVIDALDAAFYSAFQNVETTGKRIMLALDVSGSMDSPMMGSFLTNREAAAAMALVTQAREPNAVIYGFSAGGARSRLGFSETGISPLAISSRRRLDDVVAYMQTLPFGRTDCSLPMLTAIKNSLGLDAFAIYTDNETWAGSIHPFQALQAYRQRSGIDAKSAVVGMTSTGFSIANPADPGMMDFVGMDASVPALISEFIKGDL
jgi:60 kDa SS-A/Ro ribonucleoprotein